MADQNSWDVLIEDSMSEFKSRLNVNPYTDKQLHRASIFMVGPVLELASMLGAADSSPVSQFTTANLLARTTLADFINSGCISVSAIDRYLDKVEKEFLEKQAKEQESDEQLPADGDSTQPTG